MELERIVYLVEDGGLQIVTDVQGMSLGEAAEHMQTKEFGQAHHELAGKKVYAAMLYGPVEFALKGADLVEKTKAALLAADMSAEEVEDVLSRVRAEVEFTPMPAPPREMEIPADWADQKLDRLRVWTREITDQDTTKWQRNACEATIRKHLGESPGPPPFPSAAAPALLAPAAPTPPIAPPVTPLVPPPIVPIANTTQAAPPPPPPFQGPTFSPGGAPDKE